MREIKARDFFDQAYFEGKTRQSPPHSRELIYPLAARTAAFLCHRFRPRSVLDLGCAKGYLAEAFQAEGVPHVSGVDISLYAIGQSEASTRGKLIAADVQVGLPLSSSSYDLVTALDIFEHLPEPTQALREIHRVLTQRGVAYLKICHPLHPNVHRDPSHVNVQPLAYWRRVFCHSGFGCKRIFESDVTRSQGVIDFLRALVRRVREWVETGNPADYKFILWKRGDGEPRA